MGDAIKEAIITPKTLRLILPHHMMGGNHSSMTPTQSIIMLSGIYYWAMYGGSTTSILLNVPGEGTSMITCLDGYPMAKAGRAGPALGISAFGSFIAGTFSVFMLMILGPILASVAIKFGPPEYVALTFLGLTLVTYLGSGSMIKAIMMAVFGLLLGCVGLDLVAGSERFTFNIMRLKDGIGLIPIMMGLFGVAEVLLAIETSLKRAEVFSTRAKELLPTRQDWRDSSGPITRGTLIGFFLGIIPGGGGLLASLMSYAIEKKVSKHPEKFGKGAIEGVAGPETANNAGAGGSFIPLLTLGIPCNVVMAAPHSIAETRTGRSSSTNTPRYFSSFISAGRGMISNFNRDMKSLRTGRTAGSFFVTVRTISSRLY